jgi:putative methionine-R-sulfoxide reductase with GAF domain
MNEDLPPMPNPGADLSKRPSRARYDKVKAALDLKWRRRAPQAERMLRETVDGLWDAFGENPWSWCGLWLPQPDGKAYQPGPARPSAATAPAAHEGMLADALKAGQAVVQGDGQGARIVLPVVDRNGKLWALFEARSNGPFDDMDARWIERLFKALQSIERADNPLF